MKLNENGIFNEINKQTNKYFNVYSSKKYIINK